MIIITPTSGGTIEYICPARNCGAWNRQKLSADGRTICQRCHLEWVVGVILCRLTPKTARLRGPWDWVPLQELGTPAAFQEWKAERERRTAAEAT
jgi:hypothetical protein